jgi:hypothetical protein
MSEALTTKKGLATNSRATAEGMKKEGVSSFSICDINRTTIKSKTGAGKENKSQSIGIETNGLIIKSSAVNNKNVVDSIIKEGFLRTSLSLNSTGIPKANNQAAPDQESIALKKSKKWFQLKRL